MAPRRPGRFITFEGGEGAGKSTQLRCLADSLRQRGLDVVTTREPGGSEGAEQIRSLLVDGAPGRWDGITEALLHFAARRDHLCRLVWPALAQGSWVLCDRFADSTLAYQGFGHGLPSQAILQLYHFAVGNFSPDLTLILDLSIEQGLARAAARGGGEDRYERMDVAFHQRLRDGFLSIATLYPERCVVIEADAAAAAIAARILALVEQRLT
jgi:dTMP kinase